MDDKTTSPAEKPQGGGPVMDVQAPQQPAAPSTAAAPVAAKPLKAPKAGNTPVGAIVIAVVIAVSLCALTVFSYMKTKDSPTVQQNQQTEQQKATAEDVDSTTKGVDESLKSVDEAADFNDADLSDSNLGL